MVLGGVDLIALAFSVFNFLRLASYFPQIAAVARDSQGARAISFSCWAIWVGANVSTGLYAWVKLDDANFALVSMFNAACCLAVLLLAVYKRSSARSVEPPLEPQLLMRSSGLSGHVQPIARFAPASADPLDERWFLP